MFELCYQEDAAAQGAGGWEDQKITALCAISSASQQAQGINPVCNSAFSVSYIMRLGRKACPFFSSLMGWQQTSLQEDAFEYFLPKINLSRKAKRLRCWAGTRFLPLHTHICVFKAFFLLCTVVIPETSLLKIVCSVQMQLSKSQVAHRCQFLQCLQLSRSLLRSSNSCSSLFEDCMSYSRW